MLKAIVFIMLLSTPHEAYAYDDVDWPERQPGENYHILAITIDSCETRFKIKDEDFYASAKKEQATKEAFDKAVKRAESGCK